MPLKPIPRPDAPRDQAHGLRQMFAATAEAVFLPLVHNPHVAFGGVVMERLCSALGERGLNTLVVDAADTASPPHELAPVDLAACVEPLSDQVSFLAARGLAMHYLDARATTAGFLRALTEASPQANVVMVHAGAADLRRMFTGRTPRPVLLVGAQSASLTAAYAAMKILSQRLGALTYDVVIAADVGPKRARAISDRLSDCADHFLGAAVGLTAVVDPAAAPRAPVNDDLLGLVAAQLRRRDEPAEPAGPGFGLPGPALAPALASSRAASRGRPF